MWSHLACADEPGHPQLVHEEKNPRAYFVAPAAFFFDPLTAVMLCVVCGIGFFITVFAAGYMKGEEGYFGGKGWAWTLGIVVTILSVILDVVQIAFGAISNVFGLVIGILILYYLTRPHVKAFFGKGPAFMGSSPMPPPSVPG